MTSNIGSNNSLVELTPTALLSVEVAKLDLIQDSLLKQGDRLSSKSELDAYKSFIRSQVSTMRSMIFLLHSKKIPTKDLREEIEAATKSLIASADRHLANSQSYQRTAEEVDSELQKTDDKIKSLTFNSASFTPAMRASPVSAKLQKEIDKVETSYYAGYLQGVLQDNPSMTVPVFDYSENLPVLLPTLPGETHKGFIFSGPITDLHSTKSEKDILNQNFVVCKSQITQKKMVDNQVQKYQKTDVLVTGTTDIGKCDQLGNAILRDAAMVAAGIVREKKLDKEDFISDTPVFVAGKKGFNKVGDLTTLTEAVKSKIRIGNFTACNFVSLSKTRLSESMYKESGAIIVGTTNEDSCTALHFLNKPK